MSPSAALQDLINLFYQLNSYLPISQTSSPLTGTTVVVISPALPQVQPVTVYVTPAGTIAALTFTLPTSPVDGQTVTLLSSQIVSALTFTAGPTVNGAPAAMAVNTPITLRYSAVVGAWLRVA